MPHVRCHISHSLQKRSSCHCLICFPIIGTFGREHHCGHWDQQFCANKSIDCRLSVSDGYLRVRLDCRFGFGIRRSHRHWSAVFGLEHSTGHQHNILQWHGCFSKRTLQVAQTRCPLPSLSEIHLLVCRWKFGRRRSNGESACKYQCTQANYHFWFWQRRHHSIQHQCYNQCWSCPLPIQSAVHANGVSSRHRIPDCCSARHCTFEGRFS